MQRKGIIFTYYESIQKLKTLCVLVYMCALMYMYKHM